MPTAERPTSARLVDPEDDLPSDTYAGDFETTLIPHYDSTDSGSVRSSSSGVGVMGGHEPLPYQPQPTGGHSIFTPDGMGEHEHFDDERVRAAARRDILVVTPQRDLQAREREHILGVLRETGWALGRPKGVATRLGMKRSTLHWKLKKLGISRPE